jgi:hypothetical protein
VQLWESFDVLIIPVLSGRDQTLAAGSDERPGVTHHVIGGERKHDGILVAGLRERRPGRPTSPMRL